MKTMRKPISVILCMIMVLSTFCLSMTVFADSQTIETGDCGDEAQYSLDKDTGVLSITGGGVIDANAFSGRDDIIYVDIVGRNTGIGNKAFSECKNLKSFMSYTTKTIYIGDNAFEECTALEEVAFDHYVSSIGFQAFKNCYMLSDVYIASCGKIKGEAFSRCVSLEEVSFTKDVTYIGEYAFERCTKLKKVELPDEIEEFYFRSFHNCQSLTELTIPSAYYFPDDYGYLSHCIGMQSFSVSDNDKFYKTENGILYNKQRDVLMRYPAGRNEKVVVVPDGVTEIFAGAFSDCKNIEEIVLPESVEMIGEEAFYGCSNLKKINMPSAVYSIEEGAFSKCVSLTDIEIPEKVSRLCHNTFEYCVRLKNITFRGQTDTNDCEGIFNYCLNLSTITNLSDTALFSYPQSQDERYPVYTGISESNPMTLEQNISFFSNIVIVSDEIYYSGNILTDEDELNAYNKMYGTDFSSLDEVGEWEKENIDTWYSSTVPHTLTIRCKENSDEHTNCIENRICHSVISNNSSHVFDDCDLKCGQHLDVFKNDDIEPSCLSVGYKGGTICLVCAEKNDEERLAASIIEPAEPYGEIQPHTPIVEPGMEPSCLEPGFSDITYCEVCGEILSEPVSIPAVGHIDENGDGLCDVCEMIINESEKPDNTPFWERLTEFFANAINRIIAIFKKIFGR